MSDERTAAAFASSWNRVGSVYTREQFLEWIAPLTPADFAGQDVLELGFGNGSLLAHAGTLGPRHLTGIELGETPEQTRRNLSHLPPELLDLRRGDLTTASLGQFDVVYCIGVLHYLADPAAGFDSVLATPAPAAGSTAGSSEGNAIVRWIVDPIRRAASRLPWWLTKYALALPLVLPYFVYAKLIRLLPEAAARRLPLGPYSLWIAREPLRFCHHVAFDQLVTPRTRYLRRAEIDRWLRDPRVAAASAYVIFRNGNSWKFGGRRVA